MTSYIVTHCKYRRKGEPPDGSEGSLQLLMLDFDQDDGRLTYSPTNWSPCSDLTFSSRWYGGFQGYLSSSTLLSAICYHVRAHNLSMYKLQFLPFHCSFDACQETCLEAKWQILLKAALSNKSIKVLSRFDSTYLTWILVRLLSICCHVEGILQQFNRTFYCRNILCQSFGMLIKIEFVWFHFKHLKMQVLKIKVILN